MRFKEASNCCGADIVANSNICSACMEHCAAERQTIAVWFSCGAASAVAVWLTLKLYGADHDVRVLNSPIIEEHPDNFRFKDDCEKWFGVKIETVVNPLYPTGSCAAVWDDRQFMSGPLGATCTVALKKEARYFWQSENHADWHVLGFTADERKRHERFVVGELSNVIPVLIDAGLSKNDCAALLVREGLTLPKMYDLGFPNANCIGCVKATSPTYWNHVRKCFPEVFLMRSIQSRAIGKADKGARLVRLKGKRIFLDELPVNAVGRPLKSLKMPECGLFCEEQF